MYASSACSPSAYSPKKNRRTQAFVGLPRELKAYRNKVREVNVESTLTTLGVLNTMKKKFKSTTIKLVVVIAAITV